VDSSNCLLRSGPESTSGEVRMNISEVSGEEGKGGWPTFTFFVKVGTARPDVTAFLRRHE
jgi:hypothetical protein